jgi:hypothetical protein
MDGQLMGGLHCNIADICPVHKSVYVLLRGETVVGAEPTLTSFRICSAGNTHIRVGCDRLLRFSQRDVDFKLWQPVWTYVWSDTVAARNSHAFYINQL